MNQVPMATIVPLEPDYRQGINATTSTAAASDVIDRQDVALNEQHIQQLLKQGFTRGLSLSLEEMKKMFALRIWIVDNSGSMQQPDGHRIVSTGPNSVKTIPSSRWDEIVECVEYHAKFAGLIEAPTRFRLLNNPGANVGPQQFSVAEEGNGGNIMQQVQNVTNIMRKARPNGCTPLTSHILEIHNEISQMAPELRRLGKKVVIVIATDGLPTNELGFGGNAHNQEFVDALRMLEGLPVWVVVRLCTDDDSVVNFYNDLDGQLELSLEVLDDFCGEAAEVTGENPWLNYTLPLHRLREFGYHDRVFDMLDERPLLKSEIRDYCCLLFGRDNIDGMSDPSIDWDAFVQDVSRLLMMESRQYNPVTKRASPWINISRMNRIYGSSACLPSCSIM